MNPAVSLNGKLRELRLAVFERVNPGDISIRHQWTSDSIQLHSFKHGVRRYILMWLRVRRSVKGPNAAAREGGIFHLWFHPMNMADECKSKFAGLDQILALASQLRKKDQIEFLPMGAISN